MRTGHAGIGACYKHGGCSGSHKKAARRVMAETAVRTYGLRSDIDPHSALLEEVQWTHGHVAWLREVVACIDPETLTWGESKVSTEQPLANGHGEDPADPAVVAALGGSALAALRVKKVEEVAAPSVWLELYQKERRHLVEVCRSAVACGIAAHVVRVVEQQAEQIVSTVVGTLRELGLDPADPRVREVVRRNLLKAGGGGEQGGAPAAPLLVDVTPARKVTKG